MDDLFSVTKNLVQFSCFTCEREFQFEWQLADHELIHVEKGTHSHNCPICAKKFKTKSSFQRHQNKHRPQAHRCRFCSHLAATKSDLAKHVRTHTGERPFMCHVCGEGYVQSSHLYDHARVHSRAKPYECDVCNRCFSKKSDMQRHRRIHTGELPFHCKECGKYFRQRSQCANHVKKHHPMAQMGPKREEDLKHFNKSIDEKDSGNDVLGELERRDFFFEEFIDSHLLDETELISSALSFL